MFITVTERNAHILEHQASFLASFAFRKCEQTKTGRWGDYEQLLSKQMERSCLSISDTFHSLVCFTHMQIENYVDKEDNEI